jgi:hypothetical protein
MRNSVAAMVIVLFSGSAAGASDMSGRFLAQDKQARSANAVAVAGVAAQANRSTRLTAFQQAADIPIIALPKSLRPTRPPAGSPL